ncbi:hypothetical protein [Chitinasiproducens palmae]|uniref:Uncharacterized protein n=1 Tax=Chitinasiproducens palmae TaxID=1770053 RepID=A0A1H2PQR0_9BURK|nr:hypothetical protein [Chitinasiproducens palmae]SDV49183.1 hypothetical protein SAMN05216551_107135 [Chitinasiproducens palmae]
MNPTCIEAVTRAAGRELRQSEIDEIDNRIRGTARRLAGEDPAAWRALPPDQRTLAAAQRAAQDLADEAAKRLERVHLQALKTHQTETRIAHTTADGTSRSAALVHDLEQTQGYIDAVKRDNLSHLMDLLDAVTSTEGASAGRRVAMILFDTDNPRMSRDLVHEIFGQADGSSGNQTAQRGARAWLDTIEGMRERFNQSGGDVGRLEYGYIPQPHDQIRILGRGGDAARDQWVSDTLPLLDRRRYLNEDGAPMNDQQVAAFLGEAWQTLSTGGLNRLEPGAGGVPGRGARATRGSESRQIHFRDADAYLSYMAQYGSGSMYDAMGAHIGGMSRNIGLVERYGPNPNTQMRLQFDLAARADGREVNDLGRSFGARPQSYWEVVNGNASTASNAQIAGIAMTARNIQTFGKLQSALLSSITDVHTLFVTTGFNKLPYFEAMRNVGRAAFSGETKDFLTMHGVIAESMAGDMNRWASDQIRNNWSGRLANSTMKLSLLTAWTDSLRRGFSLTMMGGLARLSRTDWGSLTQYDRWRMEHAGITEDDWSVVRQAQLTRFRDQDFLTPESIRASGHARADEVVTKVLHLITDESEYAVLNPDLATRVVTTGGGAQRGTIRGELARAVMQFKAFPISLISRHWRRMLNTPQGLEGAPILANRLAYGAAFMTSATALGAIVAQVQQLRDGKDPIDMTRPKFWLLAAAKGGGLGFAGDMLLQDPNDQFGSPGANFFKSMAGPLLGTAVGDVAYDMGIANAYKAAEGKKTDFGAKAVRTARSHIPFVNLWYTKQVFDHAVMHSLQENLSPGYLGRMEQKAAQDWGQQFYWRPGSGGPQRAPNLAAAMGQ